MPKPAREVETARLEARVPIDVYEQMQRADRLRGMTLTGYLIATAGEDLARFAEALIDTPALNERQVRAAKCHAELIAPK